MAMEKSDTTDQNGAVSYDEVISYWKSIGKDSWFKQDDEIDKTIRERFLPTYKLAAAGELSSWQDNAQSSLGLILVLDQFSRNMFRKDPRAFAADHLALEAARHAIDNGFHLEVDEELLPFFIMPLMHSESIDDQVRCVGLMHCHCGEENVKYAIIHRDVIKRFGRFPHRNPVLGRHTTPAEQAFLDDGGFSA